ncbi:MAG: DUF61 family protein [Candidatus Hodarchaeota archaeon]
MTSPFDKILEKEIDSINDHMPITRQTLNELHTSSSPSYLTRGGETSFVKKEELRILAREVPEKYHEEVKIPIIILRRMDYGAGIYSVSGGKVELFLVHRLLGYVDLEWSDFQSWVPIEKLMRPQVQLLRRKFPSATCIGFVTAVGNDEKNSLS